MPAKTFVVKRVGDQYEVRRQDAASKTEGSLWAIGGGAAVLFGLIRGGLLGRMVALAGAYGVYHGVMSSNLCCAQTGATREPRDKEATAPSFHHENNHQTRQKPVDELEEAVMESFPASDAPASTRSVGAE